MAQELVNFRMDSELKREMKETCKELGMDMTTAFVIFSKKVCREKRIPFEISIDPFYSKSNIKAIEDSVVQLKQGKTVSKTLEELESMADE